MSQPLHIWQAAEARSNFPELMKQALTGAPQVVRHRNGEEVVVLSKSSYDALRPTMKEFLLHGGNCDDDDQELEEIISRNRSEGFTLMGRLPMDKA